MDRFRNLDFLEYDMDCFHQSEMEELEEYERKRNRNAERIRREQLKQVCKLLTARVQLKRVWISLILNV